VCVSREHQGRESYEPLLHRWVVDRDDRRCRLTCAQRTQQTISRLGSRCRDDSRVGFDAESSADRIRYSEDPEAVHVHGPAREHRDTESLKLCDARRRVVIARHVDRPDSRVHECVEDGRLDGRTKDRQVTGVDHEGGLVGAGDLALEFRPHRVEVQVGDVQNAIRAGERTARGDRPVVGVVGRHVASDLDRLLTQLLDRAHPV